jgi:cell division protein FtsZ
VSDISEAASEPAPVPQHQPQPQPETRRGGSLLDRLVNRGRQTMAPAARAPEPAPAPQPVARRETTAPRSGEDLDIPAFLRRQAN